jgi:small GTP-binding protein
MEDKSKPQVLKVAIVGDGFVGKTTLLRRYCTGVFERSRILTIGVDFQTVVVNVGGRAVKLTIWDIAGQERFAILRDSFYRGSRAMALAYDVSNSKSFQDLPRWREEVRRVVPQASLLVVATKIDLPRQVPREEALAFANSLPAPYCETSALAGIGVDRFFLGFALQALRGVGRIQV